MRLPRSWGGIFRNDYDHRDFCAIGASAGAALAPCFILTNANSSDKVLAELWRVLDSACISARGHNLQATDVDAHQCRLLKQDVWVPVFDACAAC